MSKEEKKDKLESQEKEFPYLKTKIKIKKN